MADSVTERILQAFRTWVKAEIGLTDDQIIPADAEGTRPALPYLTVKVLVSNIVVGTDNIVSGVDEADDPWYQQDGVRRATISLRGFGKVSAVWIENLVSIMLLPRSAAKLEEVGLTVLPNGGMQDLAAIIDTSYEDTYLQDFDVSYRIQSEKQSATEAEDFDINITLDGPTVPDQVVPGLIGDISILFGPDSPYMRRFNRPLIGAKDGANQVFTTSEKFIHNGLNDEVVSFCGHRLLEGLDNDYIAEESGGVGTGYDQIRLLLDWVPLSEDNLVIDYYLDTAFA